MNSRAVFVIVIVAFLCIPRGFCEDASHHSPLRRIQELYADIPETVKSSDPHALESLVARFRSAAAEAGISDLEQVAGELHSRSVIAAFQGETEHAAALLHAARQLAPTSVSFSLRSASLQRRLLGAGTIEELFQRVDEIRPSEWLRLIERAIPILAWITVAIVLAVIGLSLGRAVPNYLARISGASYAATIIVLALLLIVPLYLGPLWTLFAWSGALAIIDGRRKVRAAAGGIILSLWAIGAEVSEQLMLWSGDRSAQQIVSLAESRLISVHPALEQRRIVSVSDPLPAWAAARSARINGDVPRAEAILDDLIRQSSRDAAVLHERALLHALAGRMEDADALLSTLDEDGDSRLLLNHAKVQYALTKVPEAEGCVTRARKIDAPMVERWQELELLPGTACSKVWLWPKTPARWIFGSPWRSLGETGFYEMPLIPMGGATKAVAVMLGFIIVSITLILPRTADSAETPALSSVRVFTTRLFVVIWFASVVIVPPLFWYEMVTGTKLV